MLADFLTWIWPALPAFFLAGVCFVIAGVIWLVAIRRHELAMGPDPEIPPVPAAPPATIPSAPAPPNYVRREDQDTHVVARIPGATPVLSPQLAAVARYLDDVDAATEATAAVHRELGVTAWETFEQIEGLRVIPSSGPRCPTCGGPFGNCACYQKSAPMFATEPTPSPVREPEETQEIDLCPLTTQDIRIPDDEPTPQYAATPAGDATQELSARMAKIRDKERVG